MEAEGSFEAGDLLTLRDEPGYVWYYANIDSLVGLAKSGCALIVRSDFPLTAGSVIRGDDDVKARFHVLVGGRIFSVYESTLRSLFVRVS
jgi:hypothetical protein